MRLPTGPAAGMKVHGLLDWVGISNIDDAQYHQMQAAGVDVRKFHELDWYNQGRINNCTRHKILVVDGKTSFTGGVGIAPKWTGSGQDADRWRVSHLLI